MGLERHLNHLGLVVGFVGAFDPLLFDALFFFDGKKRVVVDAKSLPRLLLIEEKLHITLQMFRS